MPGPFVKYSGKARAGLAQGYIRTVTMLDAVKILLKIDRKLKVFDPI